MSPKDVFCEFEFVPVGGQRLRMVEIDPPQEEDDQRTDVQILLETLKSDPDLKSQIKEQQNNHKHTLVPCLRGNLFFPQIQDGEKKMSFFARTSHKNLV